MVCGKCCLWGQDGQVNRQHTRCCGNAFHPTKQQTLSLSQVDEFNGFSERYREMSEENRRLYNQVQDLKGNIRVFCRVRPLGATGDEV